MDILFGQSFDSEKCFCLVDCLPLVLAEESVPTEDVVLLVSSFFTCEVRDGTGDMIAARLENLEAATRRRLDVVLCVAVR